MHINIPEYQNMMPKLQEQKYFDGTVPRSADYNARLAHVCRCCLLLALPTLYGVIVLCLILWCRGLLFQARMKFLTRALSKSGVEPVESEPGTVAPPQKTAAVASNPVAPVSAQDLAAAEEYKVCRVFFNKQLIVFTSFIVCLFLLCILYIVTFQKMGNDCLAGRRYAEAVHAYTLAININGNNAIYFANRALAQIELKEFFEAIGDWCDDFSTIVQFVFCLRVSLFWSGYYPGKEQSCPVKTGSFCKNKSSNFSSSKQNKFGMQDV